jgi:ubiquinone/menaquinone biosynthesis C-methylase UbiE
MVSRPAADAAGGDPATVLAFTTHEIRARYEELAASYDGQEAFGEALLRLGRLRRRLLSRARGKTLEVAVGTGKNLGCYPPDVELTGVDLSSAMLARARSHAQRLGRAVTLAEMDAEHLDLPDGAFDTVASTLSLCTIPDSQRALREMARVCAPDGRILLLEHGRTSVGVLARLQDRTAGLHARVAGCIWNREPLALVRGAGLRIVAHSRHVLGVFHLIEAAP